MIKFLKDLLDLPIRHKDVESEELKAIDFLMDKETLNLDYVVYEMKVNNKLGLENDGASEMTRIAYPTSDLNTQMNTSTLPFTDQLPEIETQPVDYLFIPMTHVVFNEDEIVYDGEPISSGQLSINDYIALHHVLDRRLEVDDNQSEKLGRVSNVLIDLPSKKVFGLQLSEGFWKDILDGGFKYVAAAHIERWEEEPLIFRKKDNEYLFDHHHEIK